ncbi:MAG: hypothetical protein RIB84_22325 [Sneathiellaceae bacterium]
MSRARAARLLVVAPDPRVRAAVAGFAEPAGHRVDGLDGDRATDPAAALAAAANADLALVDWSLVDGAAGHLGVMLKRGRPDLGLVALVPMGTDRPEPAGWDMVAPLPLAGDTMVRMLDRWQEDRHDRD